MSSIDEEIEQLRKQIQENQEDVQTHIITLYNLGTLLRESERKDEAITEYKKAIELDKNKEYSAVVHYSLGMLYCKDDEFEEAIAELEQAIEDWHGLRAADDIKPDVAKRAYCNLGYVLLRKTQRKEHYGMEEADLERAEENFRKALEFDPNFYTAQKNLRTVRGMIELGWSVADEKGGVIKFFAGKSD